MCACAALWLVFSADSCNHQVKCADGTMVYEGSNCPNGTTRVKPTVTAPTVFSTGALSAVTDPLNGPAGADTPTAIAAGSDGSMWWTDSTYGEIGRTSPSGTTSYYTSPSQTDGLDPYGITLGPDGGTMWFVEYNPESSGLADVASIPEQGGPIHEYPLPSGAHPDSITTGRDGNLWMAESFTNDNEIDRFNPNNLQLKQFPVPVPSGSTNVGLEDIVSGPDGRIWFIERYDLDSVPTIGALNPATGEVTTHSIPGVGDYAPLSLTAGPDGALWFAGTGYYGRLTTAGKFTVHLRRSSYPLAIVAGPDGNLWMLGDPPFIDRVTPAGVLTQFAVPSAVQPAAFTGAAAAGQDGNVWFGTPGGIVQARLASAASTVVENFPLPTNPSGPEGIARGPDGTIWLTEDAVGKVAEVTAAGQVTEYSLPSATGNPGGIVEGPDGNLWITEMSADKIARMTPSGTVTEYSLPTGSFPVSITRGSDGALWFTEGDSGAIGRITTSGHITQYPVPASQGLFWIASGPDGHLWVTGGGPQIFTFAPSSPGSMTEISLGASSQPAEIVPGPDASMWFADYGTDKIGSVLVASPHTVTEYPGPTAASGGIAVGPNNTLWFTEPDTDALGRITAGGSVTEFPNQVALGRLSGITPGPAGNLWYVQTFGSQVGELLAAPPTITGVSPSSGIAGVTSVSITGTNLGYASAVHFGAVVAPILAQSPGRVTVRVPDGASSGPLTVTTQAGTVEAASPFTVSLSVSSLAPGSGPYGTVVKVLGTGFTTSAQVTFSHHPASAVSFVSSGELLATVPSGARTGSVAVSTAAGTTQSASPYYVTPHVAPKLTSLSPAAGITGSHVTLRGSYLSGASAVDFGTRPALFTVLYPNELVATVPSGATAGPISVTTAAGSASTSASFTPTLSLTSFSPASGAAGTAVTIDGVGFNASSTVSFNGVAATSVKDLSSTELQATVPSGVSKGPISVTNTTAPTGTVKSPASFS